MTLNLKNAKQVKKPVQEAVAITKNMYVKIIKHVLTYIFFLRSQFDKTPKV